MLQLRKEVWAGDTSLSFHLIQGDECHGVKALANIVKTEKRSELTNISRKEM